MQKKTIDPHLNPSKYLHTAKYINPYTDFGFKKLFGEEASKPLIIDFLNQILPPKHEIVDLSFNNPERLPKLPRHRKAIFDIYCNTAAGKRFIVEMQKAKFNYFKDRSLFYSTFPIQEQGVRGDWDFKLAPIYFIALLDFKYDEAEERQKFLRHVSLKDQDGELFYDKFHFKFIQMPLFTKGVNELETRFDKWCYFLKHLEYFEDIPAILREPIFEEAFALAALGSLSYSERRAYDESLMDYWTFRGVLDTAVSDARKLAEVDKQQALEEAAADKQQALEEAAQQAAADKQQALEEAAQQAAADKQQALRERNIEIVKKMLFKGLDDQAIADMTGLDLAFIQNIKARL